MPGAANGVGGPGGPPSPSPAPKPAPAGKGEKGKGDTKPPQPKPPEKPPVEKKEGRMTLESMSVQLNARFDQVEASNRTVVEKLKRFEMPPWIAAFSFVAGAVLALALIVLAQDSVASFVARATNRQVVMHNLILIRLGAFLFGGLSFIGVGSLVTSWIAPKKTEQQSTTASVSQTTVQSQSSSAQVESTQATST